MNPENSIKTREHMHVRAGALATRVIREAPLTLSAEEIPRLFAIEANDIALLLITRVSAKEPYVEGKGVLSAASVAGFNPGYGGDDPGYLHFGPAARVNGPIPYVHFQVYNLDHRVEHTIFCSIAMYSNEAVTFSIGRPVMWSGDITIRPGRSLLRFDIDQEVSYALARDGISIGPGSSGPAVDASWDFYFWEILSPPYRGDR